MTVRFSAYLDAKFALDGRSLNADVRAALAAALDGRTGLACLDLGTGAGASLLRLLDMGLAADLEITAVDRDAALLGRAATAAAERLAALGHVVHGEPGRIQARWHGRSITIDFVCADLREFEPAQPADRYDVVLAQQVMDLLPLRIMAERIHRWLRPGGLSYATLNYDGETALLPVYRDEAFEDRILAVYDASMEQRRVWNQASGGARSGRRLHRALLDAGFGIVACGSSDWNLVPVRGVYRDQDAICLAAMLEMIRDEAVRSGGFVGDGLDAWYGDRCRYLEAGELGLIVHQLDVLGEKVGARS